MSVSAVAAAYSAATRLWVRHRDPDSCRPERPSRPRRPRCGLEGEAASRTASAVDCTHTMWCPSADGVGPGGITWPGSPLRTPGRWAASDQCGWVCRQPTTSPTVWRAMPLTRLQTGQNPCVTHVDGAAAAPSSSSTSTPARPADTRSGTSSREAALQIPARSPGTCPGTAPDGTAPGDAVGFGHGSIDGPSARRHR